jgi:glutamyl-tRNA reductase
MAIVVVGVNHRTVPLPVLERLTFTPQTLPKGLARIAAEDTVQEGAILSTCNRTEIYATVQRFHPAMGALRHLLSEASGVSQEEVAAGLYTYWDETAVRHLLAVASGIDSMVLGEPQILGQVRDALRSAREEGTARRTLAAVFEHALRAGKRARTETSISRHVTSLPQAAVRMASELAGGMAGRTIVVLGAGRMGELAARACAEGGATDLRICNRTVSRATELAAAVGGTGHGLGDLPGLLVTADAVLSATSSQDPVLDRPILQGAIASRGRPLVVVDLGLPRDVEASARDLPDLELRDIEDLRELVEGGAHRRAAEIPKVQAIVDEEVERFAAWERSLEVGPVIRALRAWAEDIRLAEIAKAARRSGASPDEFRALDEATRGLVRKLLHLPVTRLKELASGPDGRAHLEALRELFDLDAEDD